MRDEWLIRMPVFFYYFLFILLFILGSSLCAVHTEIKRGSYKVSISHQNLHAASGLTAT